MANIVEIKDLKKSYENGNIKALNGINLEIEEGEFIIPETNDVVIDSIEDNKSDDDDVEEQDDDIDDDNDMDSLDNDENFIDKIDEDSILNDNNDNEKLESFTPTEEINEDSYFNSEELTNDSFDIDDSTSKALDELNKNEIIDESISNEDNTNKEDVECTIVSL